MVKGIAETVPFNHVPVLVDYFERDVFVGMTSREADNYVLEKAVGGVFEVELGSLVLVAQLGIENIEFVSLHHLGRRVVLVEVGLVVFVPLNALAQDVVEQGRRGAFGTLD